MTRQGRLIVFVLGGIAVALLLYGAYIGFSYIPTQVQFAFYGLFAAVGWSVIKALTTGSSYVADSSYANINEELHHRRSNNDLSEFAYDLPKRLDKRDWRIEELMDKFYFRVARIERAIANLSEKVESFDKSSTEIELLSSASEIIERRGLESIESDDLKILGKAAAILVAKGVMQQGEFANFVRQFNKNRDMNFPSDLEESQFGRSVITTLALILQQRNFH